MINRFFFILSDADRRALAAQHCRQPREAVFFQVQTPLARRRRPVDRIRDRRLLQDAAGHGHAHARQTRRARSGFSVEPFPVHRRVPEERTEIARTQCPVRNGQRRLGHGQNGFRKRMRLGSRALQQGEVSRVQKVSGLVAVRSQGRVQTGPFVAQPMFALQHFRRHKYGARRIVLVE